MTLSERLRDNEKYIKQETYFRLLKEDPEAAKKMFLADEKEAYWNNERIDRMRSMSEEEKNRIKEENRAKVNANRYEYNSSWENFSDHAGARANKNSVWKELSMVNGIYN